MTAAGLLSESVTGSAMRLQIWKQSVHCKLGKLTYCGWVKFATAVAKSVARSESYCLQNLPLETNELQVKRTAPVPQPPCRVVPPPRVVLVEPHSTLALWVADDFAICMRCGSWSKLHRPKRGLRGLRSFVPTKMAETASHGSPKVVVHGNDRLWVQLPVWCAALCHCSMVPCVLMGYRCVAWSWGAIRGRRHGKLVEFLFFSHFNFCVFNALFTQ